MNVVVYLRRAEEEELEAAGFEPKAWVRAVVKRELLKVGLKTVSEDVAQHPTAGLTVEQAATLAASGIKVPERDGEKPSADGDHRAATRSGCTYDTPKGTICKACGKKH